MRTLLKLVLGGAAALLMLSACAAEDDGVSEALSRDYGECTTSAAEPRHLAVTCRNSPFATRPREDGTVTARKIAEYVRDHHPKYKGVEDVTVALLDRKESETFVVAAQVKQAKARYVFTTAELGYAAP